MTVKTPEQVADALLLAFEIDNGHRAHIPASLVDSDLRVWMAEAIEADRAQYARPENDGTIHAAVISELNERAENEAANGKDGNYAASAAAWVGAEPDEFWDQFAGPMLDELEAAQR